MQLHAPAASMARLLIHANHDVGASRPPQKAGLHRLRAFWAIGQRQEKLAPLQLQVVDFHGHQAFATQDAGLLIEVLLPAGTYHVTATRGSVRRRYTMTLDQGVSFDLYLRLAADPS